jgi:dTMP kinase
LLLSFHPTTQPHNYLSVFFTFEGIDGCGKTTQLNLLAEYLRAQGREVVTTREPGGTKLAEAIRNYLLHSTQPLDSRAELLLFGAARAQHVAEVIRPALRSGAFVLSDRFADSSVAYQGAGLGLSADFIRQMNAFATAELSPHLTLFLDVDPAVGQRRRAAERDDRIEARGLEFQAKVREGFVSIARDEPERMIVLDASPAPDVIHQQILAVIRERGLLAVE